MIKSFKGKAAREGFAGRSLKGFPADLVKVARRKLEMINAAEALADLRTPPGNRLETLTGDRRGQHSIRINDQWRICFIWEGDGARDVQSVDYH